MLLHSLSSFILHYITRQMHNIEGASLSEARCATRYLLGSKGCLFIGGPRIGGESLTIASRSCAWGHQKESKMKTAGGMR